MLALKYTRVWKLPKLPSLAEEISVKQIETPSDPTDVDWIGGF